MLGAFDPPLGAIAGVFKVGFMVSIILWITDSLKMKFPEEWIASSWLHPIAAGFAPKVADWLSELLPAFGGVFDAL
jgi:membrane protein required for colicin V production